MICCHIPGPRDWGGTFLGAIRNSTTTNLFLSRPFSCASLPQGFAQCRWDLPVGLLSLGLVPHCAPSLKWGFPASGWGRCAPYLPLHGAQASSPWWLRRAVEGALCLGLKGLGSSPSFTNRVTLAKHFLLHLGSSWCAISVITVAQGCVRSHSWGPAPCLDCAQHTLSVTRVVGAQETLFIEASNKTQEQGRRKAARTGCGQCWRWCLSPISRLKGRDVQSLLSMACNIMGCGCRLPPGKSSVPSTTAC